MYKIEKKTAKQRTYRNDLTGTAITTALIYTDADGRKYWAFEDLLNVPFIRKKATEYITQLYSAGITRDDLTTFLATIKRMLREDDPDKYEKLFAETLRVESILTSATEPVKQSLSLCTVYILDDDERVDVFDMAGAAKKMERWAMDPDLQAFFLNWLTDGMNNYTELYAKTSAIVSKAAKTNPNESI
jgi:hypothetical protein